MRSNIIPHNFQISRNERESLNGHRSLVIWFTGLSGSGKSTIANSVEGELFKRNIHTYTLDGDNVREGLNSGLGFSEEDRSENLRRIAEVTKLFIDAGIVVIASFISPLEKDRDFIKMIIGENNFIEVFVNTSIEECERRDVKGLYKKARAGEIKNFTGISAPYEIPVKPNLEIRTEEENLQSSTARILDYLKSKFRNYY